MRSLLLIGLGLGLVAAVVFASATTGPLLARFVLFFITPLPIVLAGLGWGWRVAALAGATGTALIGLVAGPPYALAFAASHALPAVALTYLALLSREADAGDGQGGTPATEWYPPGRIVIWSAIFAGLLSAATLMMLGADLEGLRKALGAFIESMIKSSMPDMPSGQPIDPAQIDALTNTTVALLPAASAFSWMGSLLFNMWLGGRITLASGQLARPWPDLAAMEFPRGTAIAFAATLLASSLEGYPGIAASCMSGALFLAYVLVGLAIVHYATRANSWRVFVLWALYASILLANVWAIVAVAMLGLADTVLQLRQRFPPGPGPNHPTLNA
jgi:hypothetical protein